MGFFDTVKALSDPADWVKLCLQLAKEKPQEWRDRVYEAHKEVEDRFASLAADPKFSGSPELAQLVEVTKTAVYGHHVDGPFHLSTLTPDAAKAFADHADWTARRLKYAKDQPLSWKERVYETHKEIDTRFAMLENDPKFAGSRELAQLIGETRFAMHEQIRELNMKIAERKLDDDMGFVTRQIKYAKDQGIRFMDRVQEAHGKIRARLAEMNADPMMHAVKPDLPQFIAASLSEVDNYEASLEAEKFRKEAGDIIDGIKRKLKDVEGNIPRFLDRAETGLKEIEPKLEQLRPMAVLEDVEAFLAETIPKVYALKADVHPRRRHLQGHVGPQQPPQLRRL